MNQMTSGMNALIYFSNILFHDTGLTPATVTFLVGFFNFAATILGVYMISRYGRRTLMLQSNVWMTVLMGAVGFSLLNDFPAISIISVLLFICFFEVSSGPITWLYMGEILQDSAISIATVLNWVIKIVLSYAIPVVLLKIGQENIGYIFYVFAGFQVFNTLFICCFMKETKGLTRSVIDNKFYSKIESNGISFATKDMRPSVRT